jgi:hypothetical protein
MKAPLRHCLSARHFLIAVALLFCSPIAFAQIQPVMLTNGKHYSAAIMFPRDAGLWSFDANQGDGAAVDVGGRPEAPDVALASLTAPQGGTYLVLTSSDAGQGGSDRLDGTGVYFMTLAQAAMLREFL